MIDLVVAQSILGLFLMRFLHTIPKLFDLPPMTDQVTFFPHRHSQLHKAILLAVGTIHAAGTLLTVASYASIGSSSTLVWKLTEPLPAMFFKRFILGDFIPVQSIMSVLTVLAGVICFSSSSFKPSSYVPVISSNLVFPLRNTFLKMAEQSDHSKDQRYTDMLLFGLPLCLAGVMMRFFISPFYSPALPYILRNALYFNTYQFASVSLLAIFDTVAHSLLNTCKRFSGIIVSMMVLNREVLPNHYLGILISFFGFLFYLVSERKIVTPFSMKFPSSYRSFLLVVIFVTVLLPSLFVVYIWDMVPKSDIRFSKHYRLQNLDNLGNRHVNMSHLFIYAFPSSAGKMSMTKINTYNENSLSEYTALGHLVKFPRVSTETCPTVSECLKVLNRHKRRSVMFHASHGIIMAQNVDTFLNKILTIARHRAVKRLIIADLKINNIMVTNNTSILQPSNTSIRLAQEIATSPVYVNIFAHDKATNQFLKSAGLSTTQFTGDLSLLLSENASIGQSLQVDNGRDGNVFAHGLRIGVMSGDKSIRTELLNAARSSGLNLTFIASTMDATTYLAGAKVKPSVARESDNATEKISVVRQSVMDVILTSEVDDAMVALAAGTRAIVVERDFKASSMASMMFLPTLQLQSVVQSITTKMLPLLCSRKLEQWDGRMFDMNRCRVAKIFYEVYSSGGLEMGKHVTKLAQSC